MISEAMNLEFAQAGIDPHDVLPLMGRRVWIPAMSA